MIAERVFITVGTTEFDSLVSTLDAECEKFVKILKESGCKELVLQLGRGTVLPQKLPAACEKLGIAFEYFRFKPTLSEDMQKADMIISHCGAGSVLEAVTLGKVLVVVVNETLQGNHQTELSDAMVERDYCVSTVPEQLCEVLSDLADKGRKMKASSRYSAGTTAEQRLQMLGLSPYPQADLEALPAAVDSMFNFE